MEYSRVGKLSAMSLTWAQAIRDMPSCFGSPLPSARCLPQQQGHTTFDPVSAVTSSPVSLRDSRLKQRHSCHRGLLCNTGDSVPPCPPPLCLSFLALQLRFDFLRWPQWLNHVLLILEYNLFWIISFTVSRQGRFFFKSEIRYLNHPPLSSYFSF